MGGADRVVGLADSRTQGKGFCSLASPIPHSRRPKGWSPCHSAPGTVDSGFWVGCVCPMIAQLAPLGAGGALGSQQLSVSLSRFVVGCRFKPCRRSRGTGTAKSNG